MTARTGGRWTPTLRQTFGLSIAAMIVITAAVITISSYLSTRSTLLRFSRDLISHNADLVHEQVTGFLKPAALATTTALQLVKMEMVRVDDLPHTEAFFHEYLSIHETIAMLNYGDEQGNFVMVKRMPDGSLSTKLITTAGERKVIWRHRAPGGPLEPPREVIVDEADTYDPRVRPWYTGATTSDDLHWTDVYVFHTDKKPGIAASARYVDKTGTVVGVVSVDVGLVDVSVFLRDKIRVGESGSAFLLDKAGRLIALPEVERLTMTDSPGADSEQRLRTLGESPNPHIASLAADPGFNSAVAGLFAPAATDDMKRTFRYELGGEAFWVTLVPVTIGPNLRWLAGVVASEDDFLREAKRDNVKNAATATLLALLALGLGIIIARGIARSLQTLVTETAKLKRMEIDGGQPGRSRFREVDEVLEAFDGMKTGLRAFEKYVPVKLVRRLLEENVEPKLGGEPRDLTIFFSDVRGFTAISEELAPVELAEKLGEYLTTVTERIRMRNGTVDKFIGDAVMAFWGAPMIDARHAERACTAALEIQEDIARLQEEHSELPDFYTRIGIHSAEVVVGNFGSADRLNYTLIGDGVNLASRLEGVNKVFGTRVLISEDTLQRVPGLFDTRRVAMVAVKGRARPVSIYELIAKKGQGAPGRVARARRYEEALRCYLDRRWDDAIAIFEEVATEAPEDLAATTFAQQCRVFKLHPPPEEWSGVVTMESK